jgi:hypothetical protein
MSTSFAPDQFSTALGVTNANYLVGTAHGGLSAEIVVGTTPGGELGNTWASPTLDENLITIMIEALIYN